VPNRCGAQNPDAGQADLTSTTKTSDLRGGATPATSRLPQIAHDEILRQLVAAIKEYVFILDTNLCVLLANRSVYHRSAQDLLGLHVNDFFPPKLLRDARPALKRTLGGAGMQQYDAQITDPEGCVRSYEVHVHPLQADGKIVALALVGHERTDRNRAERVLAIQAGMIESMHEGVALIDEHAVIGITNPAFDRMFGYDRGELVGRDMTILAGWPFEKREHWQARTGGRLALEFGGRRADGSRFAVEGVLSKFDDAGGRNQSLMVIEDASERKLLERAVLETLSREQYCIGNDLHDGLGQELTGVALMLRGVAGRLASEYPALLADIEGITVLVNNAIETSRALARGLSPVNLERGGLQDALQGLAVQAREFYGVRVVCTQRMASVRTLSAEFSNHLYRIAQEAVGNAARHSQARTIRLYLTGSRGKVRLTITDDGIGMPEGTMDAESMGLKIMRYRARILGGDICFERRDPSGTCVICECPLEVPARTRRTRGERSKSAPARGGS